MTPIKIDLRKDLKKALRSRKRLLKNLGRGRYSAPCVVGTMMAPGARDRLVENGQDYRSVSSLIESGALDCPEDQRSDLVNLQLAFDGAHTCRLNSLLDSLTTKYATPNTVQSPR